MSSCARPRWLTDRIRRRNPHQTATPLARKNNTTFHLKPSPSREGGQAVIQHTTTMSKNEKLDTKRHSLAHIMAASIQDLFPEAKFGVGPVIEDGFYYDVYLNRTLTPEDLQQIEKRMKAKVKEGLQFERSELPIDRAAEMFANSQQAFKVELLRD